MDETVGLHQALARVAAATSELAAANQAVGDLFDFHTGPARCDHISCWSPEGNWSGCLLVEHDEEEIA